MTTLSTGKSNLPNSKIKMDRLLLIRDIQNARIKKKVKCKRMKNSVRRIVTGNGQGNYTNTRQGRVKGKKFYLCLGRDF